METTQLQIKKLGSLDDVRKLLPGDVITVRDYGLRPVDTIRNKVVDSYIPSFDSIRLLMRNELNPSIILINDMYLNTGRVSVQDNMLHVHQWDIEYGSVKEGEPEHARLNELLSRSGQ